MLFTLKSDEMKINQKQTTYRNATVIGGDDRGPFCHSERFFPRMNSELNRGKIRQPAIGVKLTSREMWINDVTKSPCQLAWQGERLPS
ncbi:MAG: hypothetical protein D6814_10365 [Calditrichaeota bacterium]|nr:MAG: hypothetical protein D6814_10365 [Calditrichota bacterium]